MALYHSVKGPVNYNVVGTPTIVDGIASGFSSSDFLRSSQTVAQGAAKTFEISTKFTTPSEFGHAATMIGYTNYFTYGLLFEAGLNNQNFTLAGQCRSGGAYYRVSTTSGYLQPLTTYYAKLIVDGELGTLTLKISTDNQNWDEYTAEYTVGVYNSDSDIVWDFGYGAYGAFTGSIDLNHTYIKVNGQPWFGVCPIEVKKVVRQANYPAEVSGVDSVSLPKAKANSLTEVKLYGGTEQRNLPAGYTQVEYLEVETSGAYFSTGINATIDTDMGITASNITSSSAQLLVAQCVSGSDYFRIAKAGASQRIIGSFGSSTVTDDNTDGIDKFTARMNKSGFYVNGNLVGTFSALPSSLTGIGAVDIFSGKYSEIVYYAYIGSRFYSSWVDDNTFLPCRRNSDNQLGIYNTKTGQFILPSGEGSFTAGPDITAPSPDYPMDIVCNNGAIKVSSNLANYTSDNIVLGEAIDKNTGAITSNTYNFRTDYYIPVTPNTSYVAYGRNKTDNSLSRWNRIAWYDSSKNWISGGDYTDNSITVNISPSNAFYARFSCNIDGSVVATQAYVDSFNWVFQQGTGEVTYRPYGSTYIVGTTETVTDSLSNTASAERLLAVGSYKDTQEILSGAVTRNIGITILRGTETWNKSSTYTGSFYCSTYSPDSGAKVANNPTVLCSHGFKVDNLGSYSSASIGACYWYSAPTINYKYDDGTATVEEFKQWLVNQYNAGTPVIIVYPLATATTETVTAQTLNVQTGNNTLSVTQASMSGLGLSAKYTQPTRDVNYVLKDDKLVFADSGLYLTGPNNYTVVGTPTIVDNVASNFSNSSYIHIADYSGTPQSVEFYGKFTTGADVSSGSWIFSAGSAQAGFYGLQILNGYCFSYFGKSGGFSYQSSDPYTISPNTTYYYSLIYTASGLAWKLGTSKDNLVDMPSRTEALLVPLKNANYGINLTRNAPMLGTIDLNETYIKVNGSLWFYGKNYASKNIAPVPAGYTYGNTTTPSIGYVDMRTQAFTAAPAGATIGRDE